MNPKLEKLLRLALCPSAANGESDNAAVAFVRSARSSSETFESLFPKRIPEPVRTAPSMIMPFGKWKGSAVRDVDTGYLEWALNNLNKISPRLKSAIAEELMDRGEN